MTVIVVAEKSVACDDLDDVDAKRAAPVSESILPSYTWLRGPTSIVLLGSPCLRRMQRSPLPFANVGVIHL
jgi:hypothetical protein